MVRHASFHRFRLATAVLAVAVSSFAVDASASEASIAVQLATGADIEWIQRRVTELESKAIAKREFSDDDKSFLRDLYGAMAFGAERSGVLRESGRLMTHYLDCSGEPLELGVEIFSRNARVRSQMERLAAKLTGPSVAPGSMVRTPRFYMPDASRLDSVTGLYWGTVTATLRVGASGRRVIHYRAEVPWEWPSYESLRRRYGTPHAETFALPNLRSAFAGPRYALHIENGLGEYLVHLGLAKPFVAWAEWEEER